LLCLSKVQLALRIMRRIGTWRAGPPMNHIAKVSVSAVLLIALACISSLKAQPAQTA
jgi:hypothetical protein